MIVSGKLGTMPSSRFKVKRRRKPLQVGDRVEIAYMIDVDLRGRKARGVKWIHARVWKISGDMVYFDL